MNKSEYLYTLGMMVFIVICMLIGALSVGHVTMDADQYCKPTVNNFKALND